MFLFNSMVRFVPWLSSSTNNFAHAQTLSRMSSLSGRMNIARVNIGFFTGFKKVKQQHISFILGYLRMILWKISTGISIKHRILATFNIKKNYILTACMPLRQSNTQLTQAIFQMQYCYFYSNAKTKMLRNIVDNFVIWRS